MKRRPLAVALGGLLLSLAGCTIVPEPSTQPGVPSPAPPPPPAQVHGLPPKAPELINLPNGFAPSGIAVGPGPTAYLGDRQNGAIYRVRLATGQGGLLSPPTGKGVQGMKLLEDRLYVAGTSAGDARVIDANTGVVLTSLPLVKSPNDNNNLVDDALLTKDAWWLTESRGGVLYRVALPPDGQLPTVRDVRAIPLIGDYHNQPGINVNGIVSTPDGTGLLVVQANTGRLLRVDPESGKATFVDLGGELLKDGDGLLLDGQTLYVTLNESNTLAVVQLEPGAIKGKVTKRITDPRFDSPTSIAAVDDRLYLPNARFGIDPPTPTTPYTLVSVRVPK